MQFRFTNQANTKAIAIGANNKTIATLARNADEWEVTLKPGVELAENGDTALIEAFSKWYDDNTIAEPEEMPVLTPADVAPPRPDPVAGTTGIEYITWATAHATDERFLELYAPRWENQSFRDWVRATVPAAAERLHSLHPSR